MSWVAVSPTLSGYSNPLIAYLSDSYYGGGFALFAEALRKTHRSNINVAGFDPLAVKDMDGNATTRAC